jgi:proteic killer suppression protein
MTFLQMNVPGWKLYPLTGSLSGRWSVGVSGNWRLTFGFDGTLARRISVLRVQLSRLIHGHAPLTAAMAVALEGMIPVAVIETWMKMQVARDLWLAAGP